RAHYDDITASRAAVLCGKGNNGGDGFVVARLLQEKGLKPSVYLFTGQDAVRGDASENLARLKKSGARIQEVTTGAKWEQIRGEVAKSRVIVDALLGT
ncbi:MAG: bifunctional ADP-dependent NAD(P)H-hydrate dehydratase/NAD(P)H-hydrate epimerase, partial [Acidobacteria bacterium]